MSLASVFAEAFFSFSNFLYITFSFHFFSDHYLKIRFSFCAYEAYALKKGVCQDYAHLMLCLMREFNIPCRYVNGFIEGEGQTHAWFDVLVDGYWHGFDPTHNRKIEYGYISLAHGRDAADCSVSRGVFSSKSNNRMSAFVCVGRL